MPRGVKGSGPPKPGKSIESKIADIDEVIDNLQTKLADAKARKKEFLQIKEQADLETIQKLIHKSGMTPDELKEMIKKK